MHNILKNLRRTLSRATGKPRAYKKQKADFSNLEVMLTISEASEFLHLHITTIRRWSNDGVLKAYRFGPRGDRRFRVRDLNDFLSKSRGNEARIE